jgi:hypothetical protein
VCEYVNQTGAKLAGSSVEDLVGHRARDFSPRGVEAGLLDRCADVLTTGQVWRREVQSTDAGQTWEIKISRADADHVAVSFRDVTERVQQQARITHGEAQARDAAERTAALQALTAALAAASTPAEVYAVIGSLVRPSAGGAGLVVLLADEGRLTSTTTPATTGRPSTGCTACRSRTATRRPTSSAPAGRASSPGGPSSTRHRPPSATRCPPATGTPGRSCR